MTGRAYYWSFVGAVSGLQIGNIVRIRTGVPGWAENITTAQIPAAAGWTRTFPWSATG